MKELTTYLAPLLQWLSSGPVGIAVGLLGMLTIGGGILFFRKLMSDAKFKSTLDESSGSAGKVSGEVSSGMKGNTDLGEKWAEQEQDRLIKSQVKISAPKEVFVDEPFQVVCSGITVANTLYADRVWRLGSVLPDEPKEVLLNSAGKRTLDVLIGKTWVTVDLLVKEKVA